MECAPYNAELGIFTLVLIVSYNKVLQSCYSNSVYGNNATLPWCLKIFFLSL